MEKNFWNTSVTKKSPLFTPFYFLMVTLWAAGAIIASVYYGRDKNTVALVGMIIFWSLFAFSILSQFLVNGILYLIKISYRDRRNYL